MSVVQSAHTRRPQAPVEIYTKSWCGFCHRAKNLLRARGIEFVEIDVTQDPERERDMVLRTGSRTVPQIFIHGRAIGGATDLIALDHSGDLQAIIAGDCAEPENCTSPVAYGDRDAFRAAVGRGGSVTLGRVNEWLMASALTTVVFAGAVITGLFTSGIIEF